MPDIKIEAVKCINCGSGLVTEINDFAVYCTNCGSGFEIISGEFVPVEVNFASAAFREEAELIYKPFWFLKTTIEVLERTAAGGNFLKN
ncbi:hypothetical protein D4R20_00755, partial [bacterium]